MEKLRKLEIKVLTNRGLVTVSNIVFRCEAKDMKDMARSWVSTYMVDSEYRGFKEI